jgi:hypothetical protein
MSHLDEEGVGGVGGVAGEAQHVVTESGSVTYMSRLCVAVLHMCHTLMRKASVVLVVLLVRRSML